MANRNNYDDLPTPDAESKPLSQKNVYDVFEQPEELKKLMEEVDWITSGGHAQISKDPPLNPVQNGLPLDPNPPTPPTTGKNVQLRVEKLPER